MTEYRTIGEVSEQLGIPPHVLRFWENEFKEINPAKRKGGRRFYSKKDVESVENIRILLHVKGYTIKGAKRALKARNQGFLNSAQTDMFGEGEAAGEAANTTPPTGKEKRLIKKVEKAEKKQLKKILSELRELEDLVKKSA